MPWQTGEWISVTEQGKLRHIRKQFDCHSDVICQFNALLTHSDAIDRASNSTGLPTARSQWEGCSQSEHRIKVSKAFEQADLISRSIKPLTICQHKEQLPHSSFCDIYEKDIPRAVKHVIKHLILASVPSRCSAVWDLQARQQTPDTDASGEHICTGRDVSNRQTRRRTRPGQNEFHRRWVSC